jgi:hypothetical protein
VQEIVNQDHPLECHRSHLAPGEGKHVVGDELHALGHSQGSRALRAAGQGYLVDIQTGELQIGDFRGRQQFRQPCRAANTYTSQQVGP